MLNPDVHILLCERSCRSLVLAGLAQILLDIICLALAAAAAWDSVLHQALIVFSAGNFLLAALVIGKTPRH